MRALLLALGLFLAPIAAWADCQPSAAKTGEMGCQPVATTIAPTDFIETWAPALYPKSAQIIRFNNLMGSPGAIGSITPAPGTFSTLHITGDATVDGTMHVGNTTFNSATIPSLTATTSITSPLINGVFYATGLKNDGVTSDDVALKARVDACNAKGAALILPAGKILLTGAASITLNGCVLYGSGAPGYGQATAGAALNKGTTILLTSTTVKPFILGEGGGVIGVNFYWPNQTTGLVVYPPLFGDAGGATFSTGFYFDHLTIFNAYDGWAQTNSSWGDLFVTNSTLYAINDLFRLSSTGGSFVMSDLLLGPGPWFNANAAVKTNGAGNVAAAKNSIIHAISHPVGVPGVTISLTNANTFAWRTAIKIDAGGSVGNSVMTWNFDGMGTLIDASAGGNYAEQNTFMGSNSGCGIVVWPAGTGTGNAPCFDMGANSQLRLLSFSGGTSRGDYIRLSGGLVRIRDSALGGIGQAADGGDYYMVHVTGGPTTEVVIQNSQIAGRVADAHVHGISTGVNVVSRMIVTGNSLGQFNDVISAPYSPTTIVTGNYSLNTTGPTSVLFTGTANGATFRANQFDKMPKPVIFSGFGVGATTFSQWEPATVQINVGSGGTASVGVVTMPIVPAHGYACSAVSNTGPVTSDTVATATAVNQITLTNFSRTTGLQTAWPAGAIINVTCGEY